MPDVVGLDADEAIALLEAAGWVSDVYFDCPPAGCGPDAEDGVVYAQDPVAGERIERYSVVTLRVFPRG